MKRKKRKVGVQKTLDKWVGGDKNDKKTKKV